MEKLSQEVLNFLSFNNTPGIIWLHTKAGRKFLNSEKALVWLLSKEGGEIWFSRGEAISWLEEEDCRMADHLSSLEGYALLKNSDVLDWISKNKKGQYWLRTGYGFNWLKTQDGQEWLESPAGKKWLNVPKELLEKN